MSPSPASIESFHPGPYRLAVLLVCATFPLIWVGGLVTTYDAGMAVPDWPSTYGWNLFLYPWQSWLAGPWDLMIEHGHRLLGALVGFLSLGFLAAVFVWDRRLWMRFVSVLAVAAVVAQGVLGGGRVLMDERQLAQWHGCLGPLCFACFVALTTLTSRWWYRQESSPPLNDLRLGTNCWLVVVLAVGQLILGSQLRHISTTASFGDFRVAVVFHLVLALALVVYVLGVLWRIVVAHRRLTPLLWPAALLTLLLCLQLLLGAGSWVVKYSWPSWLQQISQPPALTIEAEGMLQTMTVTAHVAVGSLILATSLFLALRVSRVNHFVALGAYRRSTWGGLVA